MALEMLVLLAFPALIAFAGASDLLTMTISNRIQIALVVCFFAAATLAGVNAATIGWHLAAGMLVLVVGFTFFAFGWIGGGDAKLMAATALWFGFTLEMVEYLLIGTVYGGLLTIFLISARGYPLPATLSGQSWIARLHDQKSGIPYGIALAAAALTVFPKTSLFAAAVG
jgi:prepilin peptidase CpaA